MLPASGELRERAIEMCGDRWMVRAGDAAALYDKVLCHSIDAEYHLNSASEETMAASSVKTTAVAVRSSTFVIDDQIPMLAVATCTTPHDNINIDAKPSVTYAAVLLQPPAEQSAVKVMSHTPQAAVTCRPRGCRAHASPLPPEEALRHAVLRVFRYRFLPVFTCPGQLRLHHAARHDYHRHDACRHRRCRHGAAVGRSVGRREGDVTHAARHTR
eukprot:1111653-Prymnesium_polylepis.1